MSEIRATRPWNIGDKVEFKEAEVVQWDRANELIYKGD